MAGNDTLMGEIRDVELTQALNKQKFEALIETVAKAGIAVGVDGIFIETHPDPAHAKSDGANMLRLDLLEELLAKLVKIRQVVNA